MVNKFKQRIGSRAQVMRGTAKMTGGGLKKKDLKYNKQNKIVSRKASNTAKRVNKLVKAGYITQKGVFGSIMKGGMNASPNKNTNANVSPNKNTNTSPNKNTNTSPNKNANASPNKNANASPNKNANANASPNKNANANASPNKNTNANVSSNKKALISHMPFCTDYTNLIGSREALGPWLANDIRMDPIKLLNKVCNVYGSYFYSKFYKTNELKIQRYNNVFFINAHGLHFNNSSKNVIKMKELIKSRLINSMRDIFKSEFSELKYKYTEIVGKCPTNKYYNLYRNILSKFPKSSKSSKKHLEKFKTDFLNNLEEGKIRIIVNHFISFGHVQFLGVYPRLIFLLYLFIFKSLYKSISLTDGIVLKQSAIELQSIMNKSYINYGKDFFKIKVNSLNINPLIKKKMRNITNPIKLQPNNLNHFTDSYISWYDKGNQRHFPWEIDGRNNLKISSEKYPRLVHYVIKMIDKCLYQSLLFYIKQHKNEIRHYPIFNAEIHQSSCRRASRSSTVSNENYADMTEKYMSPPPSPRTENFWNTA